MILVLATPSASQVEGPGSPFFPNFVYSSQLGIGVYEKDELSVRVARLPFSYTLQPIEDSRWGWKFHFPVILGHYQLESSVSTRGLDPSDLSLDALSVLPGIEALVPLRSNWLLRPFAQVGYGTDLGGGASAWLYSSGVRSLAFWDHGETRIAFGSSLTLGGNKGTSGLGSDSYASLDLGLEIQRPIPLHLAGEPVDVGVYVAAYQFIGDLEVARFLTESLVTPRLYEVGFSFGTEEKVEILGLGVPRLGLGYRFGSGLRGLLLNFGFPF